MFGFFPAEGGKKSVNQRFPNKKMQKTGVFCIRRYQLQVDDLAHNGAGAASSVCFVGIQVHSQGKLVANAADNVAENQAAAVGLDLDPNNVFVLNAHLNSVFGGDMDVALCNDNALGQLDFAAGTNQFAGSGASYVAGLTDRSDNTQCTGIGQRNFDLVSRSFRTEDRTFQGAFGADNGDLLFAGELAGLREVFLVVQNGVCAEQGCEGLFGNMYVSCGSLNDELFSHNDKHSFQILSFHGINRFPTLL